MKFNFAISKIVTEIVDTISFRQRLKKVATTPLYRNALYLMFDTVITAPLGFLFWVVAARFYSETEVGYGSAIISAINLLALLSIVGLNFSIIRFLPQAENPHKLINFSFTLSGLITIVTAAIFIAGLGFWSPALGFVGQNAIFALTFLVIAVLSTLSSLMDTVFIAKRKAGFVLFGSVITSILKIPLLIALTVFFHTFGVVASWGIALGIATTISVFLFLPRVEAGYKPVPTLNLSRIKGMWEYSSSSYVASLLSAVPIMILPIMVVNLLGTESNAYFYVAWMIAGFLFAIPWSVSQSLFAEGAYSEESLRQNVTKSIKFTFLLLVPATAALILAAKWVLLAFGQSYSANALELLWLVSLSSLPLAISNIYTSLLRLQDRLKELLIIRSSTAVIVLTLSYFIMPMAGIIGIGYVWLGVQVVVSLTLILRLHAWFRGKKKDSFGGETLKH